MPNAIIASPQRTPVSFGLFSALAFENPAGERWENGATFEGGTCGLLNGFGPLECEVDDTLTRTYDDRGITWGTATAFSVYGSFQCAPVGYSFEDAEDRAVSDLLTHEESTVEDILWHGHYGVEGLATVPTLGAATSLTVALADLEQAGAKEYGVQGVIHMPRKFALMALGDNLLKVTGQRLVTQLGTPVVAGAGYAPEDNRIVITPTIAARRSEAYPLGETGNMFDREHNLLTTVAERDYLIGYDTCQPFAAEVGTYDPVEPGTYTSGYRENY